MKGLKVLTVLYTVVLIAGCALPLGEDYLISRDGSDAAYITDYNLQSYVPIPRAGDPPVALVNRGDLEASVVWKDNAGTEIPLPFDRFLSGTVYQVEIRLRAKPGYGFYPSIPFGYAEGKITSQTDDLGDSERVVRVIYNNSDDADITFITDYNLQGYVPIPGTGEVWSEPNRGDVTVEAVWGKKNPSNGFDPLPVGSVTFEEGAVYQAEIRLKANAGYRFMTERSFDYPVETVNIQPLPNTDLEDRVLSMVEYKATRTPAVIDDLNLTPYISKPISGVMPLSSFAGSQYTGRVVWKDMGTQTVPEGPFEEGVEYTAEVSLIPAIGYTFRGVGQNGFTHTGAGTVTNSADSGSIHIEFSAAPRAGGSTVVYDTDLTGRIHRPISGESPVKSIAGSQYTGTVTWMPAPHGTFLYDTVYRAVLNLNAAPGYTFGDIGQNVFTHGDAPNAVTNLGSSGTVTITFPPTISYTYKAITSFGPVGAEGSALKMMRENKNENSLTIDLVEDTEEVIPDSVTLTGDNSPAKVIINGHNRVLRIQSPGTLLTVGEGVSLTLRNITLRGYSGNNAPLVKVAHGGKLILGTGVTLMGNKTTGDVGGVWVNSGELILNEGAVIKGMEAQRGGGALIDGYGNLTMNGGTIGGELFSDGNVAAGEKGGGGVLVLDGSFAIVGGIIQSNRALAQGSGGGVLIVDGSFGMFEGIVQSNRALAQGSGGGVAILTTGTFSLYNGAIKGNRAEYAVAGTGVESGGAVFVFGENYYSTVGRFNMYGGTIGGENSEDANTANIGANAVWSNEGEFTMSGGTITGNAGYGNYGVYIIRYLYSSKVFAMRGTARIDENDKVFLSSGAKITIGGALSASPAANIIHENPVPGTTYLLEATSSGLMTENYQKFLYDGADNRIITFYDGWYAWYGVYN